MNKFQHSSIYQLLKTQSDVRGQSVALWDGRGAQVTYSELLGSAQRLMAWLGSMGVAKADRIALVMPNGMEFSMALLAISSMGAAVPLNPVYKKEEFRSYFLDMKVKWLLVHEDDASPAAAVAKELRIRVIRIAKTKFPVKAPRPDEAIAADSLATGWQDICLILLTSGSTGKSKKVPLTQRNVLVSTRQICETLTIGETDKCLCMWEQFHVGGLVDLLLVPLASGGSILAAGSFDSRRLYEVLKPEGITWFQAVPTTLRELVLNAPKGEANVVPSDLRFIRSVASALAPSLMGEVEELFGVPVVQTFGMTEAGPLITTNRLPPFKRKPGSVGYSCGPELKVVSSQNAQQATGEIGEILVRGENIFAGYEDAPEANAVSFSNGWFRTGDTGYLDEEDFLFLTGRVKEMINRGGEKITPQEIDDVLQAHPAIAEAAAFSVKHLTLGEDVAAAVVLKPRADINEQQIRTFVGEKLANFKVPQRIYILDKMPRDPVGKINRLSLATVAENANSNKIVEQGETPSQRKIFDIWRSEFRGADFGIDDNFFSIGGDSLSGVRIILAIEQALDLSLPPNIFQLCTTVREFSKYVDSQPVHQSSDVRQEVNDLDLPGEHLRIIQFVMASGRIPPVMPGSTIKGVNLKGKKMPLVWCFNSPDKEVTGLMTCLDSDRPLLALYSGSMQLPYDERTVKRIAYHYASQLKTMFKRGNFILAGNCRGGRVAHEILKLLEADGIRPPYVFFVEYSSPELFDYPKPMMMLFGKNSIAKAYLDMNIFAWGWREKFKRIPRVHWVNGARGQFFRPDNAKGVVRRLEEFLSGSKRKASAFERLCSKLIWLSHKSDILFEAYYFWYRLKGFIFYRYPMKAFQRAPKKMERSN